MVPGVSRGIALHSVLLLGVTGALGFAPLPPARAPAASSCRTRAVMMSSPRVAVVTGIFCVEANGG